MTKFAQPTFNSPANSKQYRDNFDAVFGKKKKAQKKEDPSAEPINDTDEEHNQEE